MGGFHKNGTIVCLWKVLGSEPLLTLFAVIFVKVAHLRNCRHCTFSEIRLETRIKLYLSKVCTLLEWWLIISVEVSSDSDHSQLRCLGFAGSH